MALNLFRFALNVCVFVRFVETNHRACEKLPSPYYGVLHGTCDGTIPGRTCNLTCDVGYTSVGPTSRVCNGTLKKWVPATSFSCLDRRKHCLNLRTPENGFLRGPCSTSAGSVCHFECKSGYRLVGSQTVVCTRVAQKWIPAIPRCKRQRCPRLPKFHHPGPWPKGCSGNAGEDCRFVCSRGYAVVGQGSVRCSRRGRWLGNLPNCVLKCPSISSVPNGQLFGDCSPGLVGKSCYVLCQDGFQVTGSGFITCESNGKWDAKLPACERRLCEDIEAPENASMTGQCTPGVYGEPCVFTCKEGFRLKGREAIHCKYDGKWSHPSPSCEKIICPSPLDANVANFEGACQPGVPVPGDWCNITCVPGYSSFGESSMKCLATGSWSTSIPVCTKRTHCALPKAPSNGRLLNCSTEIGTVCQQVCNGDFVAQGTLYRKCLPSGEWDGTKVRCVHKMKFMNHVHP